VSQANLVVAQFEDPAMEAGISGHVWTLNEVIALLD